jgi:hypothetical protein
VRVNGPAFRLLIALATAGIVLSSCGGGSSGEKTPEATPEATAAATPSATADRACAATPASTAGNAFQNAGFESGGDPWTSLSTADWGTPFVVSQQQAHSGSNSAYLQLRSEDGGATKVYGVVQELPPTDFPETLSGYYYVDPWEKGTPKQYLQFAVIVNDAANIPTEVTQLRATNHQIRYILAGVDSQPTNIANSRYVFVSKDAPKQGEWVHFERNIRQDFCDLWGSVPVGYSSIRVLFETRWDDRAGSDGPAAADVYYDDLYWGPAAGADPPLTPP